MIAVQNLTKTSFYNQMSEILFSQVLTQNCFINFYEIKTKASANFCNYNSILMKF